MYVTEDNIVIDSYEIESFFLDELNTNWLIVDNCKG